MKQVKSRRDFLKLTASSLACALFPGCAGLGRSGAKRKRPNIVLIFLDDSGWSDFEPFGQHEYHTPNVNRLASEGCCFTHFYVPQAVCSASRASLLCGCFPGRTKVFGALRPKKRGLEPKYKIMSEVLGANGYKTAVFGKWHIGDDEGTRPWDRGFDESCGLLYSNDMWGHHPQNPEYWAQHPLQFFEKDKATIESVQPEDQAMLTTWYTEHSVDFIKRHKDVPFFLYVPHSMPHVPIYVSDKFRGKSGQGLYGDVIMEIDWSVGQINQALKECGIEDDTLVILSSDNGPWIVYGNHAGQTPFREAKGTTFDGGIRSACIMKYPGKIAAGSESEQMFSTVDLMPTLAGLAGAVLPDGEIDGRDVWDIIAGKAGAENPHDYYPFSNNREFQGVISGDGRWKLHVTHEYRTLEVAGKDGKPGEYKKEKIGWSLFDMKNDPMESEDVKDKYPEIFECLKKHALGHKQRFYSKQKI